MADEAGKLGMGEGTTFVVSGSDLFGMIHAAAAQAVYADRKAGGHSVIAYADGVKHWFEANPNWVPDHRIGGAAAVEVSPSDPAFDVQINLQLRAPSIEGINDRVEATIDRNFPTADDSVLEAGWEAREVKS